MYICRYFIVQNFNYSNEGGNTCIETNDKTSLIIHVIHKMNFAETFILRGKLFSVE